MTFTRRSFIGTAAAGLALPALGRSALAAEPLKVGFVYLGAIGDYGWTWSHDQGRKELLDALKGQVVTNYVENVKEDASAIPIMKDLAQQGNKLIFTLQNILANPQVALIFLVPGTEETLRVHGRAELIADPETLRRLTARGQPALLAIRVHVERCFFHCAKAFRRSHLWEPATWPPKLRVSFGKMLATKLGGGADLAERIDRSIEEDYEKNL